jgi:uncharacterized protein (TIRG00374 family)
LASKFRKVAFDIVKYTITLGIAGFLLWYVYRDLSFENLLSQFDNINYYWISLSVIIALLSHYLRAFRWNILLKPLGYDLKAHRTFIAVMVGYFANNLVPRLGEVTRCGILKKTDDVAITSAFGSVVAERAFDLLTLILVAAFTFFIEFDKLSGFILDNFQDSIPDTESLTEIALIVFVLFAIIGIGLFFVFKLFRESTIGVFSGLSRASSTFLSSFVSLV